MNTDQGSTAGTNGQGDTAPTSGAAGQSREGGPSSRRLTELRGGPGVPPRPLDARALAALAANPGCRRRALLDGAGVDKGALAASLGAPAPFGQSQFAFVRGNAFEARVTAEGGAALIRLLCERTGEPPPEPGEVTVPDLAAGGPAERTARTRLALEEATHAVPPVTDTTPAPDVRPGSESGPDERTGTDGLMRAADLTGIAGPHERVNSGDPYEASDRSVPSDPSGSGGSGGSCGWTLLRHPMLALEVAGSRAYVEPDAIAVHPDGGWSVIEIKSFPILDGSAEASKVGAAARQSAVYALALDALSAQGPRGRVRDKALLVCPKDFSNIPTAHDVDIRKQRAATRRQLDRLTRVEEIAAALPDGTVFDPSRPGAELTASVGSLPAAYAPECLSSCELAFHCRSQAREAGAVEALGRSVRGELGGLRTIPDVLAAARAPAPDPDGDGDGDGDPDGETGLASPTDPQTPVADPRTPLADAHAAEALRRAARLRAEALGVTPCR